MLQFISPIGSFLYGILNVIVVGLLVWFILKVVLPIIEKKAKKKYKLISYTIAPITSISGWFWLLVLFYVLIISTSLFSDYHTIVNKIFFAFAIIQGVITISKITFGLVNSLVKLEVKGFDSTTSNFLQHVISILFWIIGIMIYIKFIGLEITPILASLGIGGIAIAFALQNILQDVFASFSIFFQKPFKVGDQITLGVDSGKVLEIGLQRTRIKTIDGFEIIIPNKDILNSRISNTSRLTNRRVSIKLDLDISTDTQKIDDFGQKAKEYIQSLDDTEFTRYVVTGISSRGIQTDLVYHIHNKNFDTYIQLHNLICRFIVDYVHKEKIELYKTSIDDPHQKK